MALTKLCVCVCVHASMCVCVRLASNSSNRSYIVSILINSDKMQEIIEK